MMDKSFSKSLLMAALITGTVLWGAIQSLHRRMSRSLLLTRWLLLRKEWKLES